MNQKPDAELIAAIQNGDIRSFEELVRRYQQPLFLFAARILRNDQDAQDVVSEALFNIYRHIDAIDKTRKISTYIFAVTKNSAFSVLRAKKYALPLDEAAEVADAENIYEHLIRKEDAVKINQAINILPEKYRKVIRLYYFEDLAYEEIARICDMPVNTVRTLLRRAKAKLKPLLDYETD
jgi:RNA polymerase sigma-70 factor, ECF subfamily